MGSVDMMSGQVNAMNGLHGLERNGFCLELLRNIREEKKGDRKNVGKWSRTSLEMASSLS